MHSDHGYTTRPLWRESSYVGKVGVQSYKASLFVATYFIDVLIRAAQHILFPDSLDIVPGSSEYVLSSTSEILV